jgi:hypothetical protein
MIEKTPEQKQKELDDLMKKFLEKGGKIEKLPPGSAYNLGSLDRSGKPQWTQLEIRAGKDKKNR